MVKLSLIEGLDGMSVIEVINLIFPFPTNQVYILASCIWQPFKVSVFYKERSEQLNWVHPMVLWEPSDLTVFHSQKIVIIDGLCKISL